MWWRLVFLLFSFANAFTPSNMKIRVQKMSTWVAYDMKRPEDIQTMIPEGTEILPVRILSADIARPKLLFNMYQCAAPFFRGVRLEVVTLVRQKSRPRNVHFVVLDCMTDTIHWDPIHGIQMPNAQTSFASLNGKHDICCTSGDKEFRVSGVIGRTKAITKMFAVDANYECFFRDSLSAVTLKFKEAELMQDVKLFSRVDVSTNMWEAYRGRMTHVFVHPHSMDFLAGFRQKTFE